MKRGERMVLYYDLRTIAKARGFEAPEPLTVKRAIALLQLVPREAQAMKRAKGAQTVYVADADATPTFLKLLIAKSDKGLPDPVFSNPQRRSRRTAAKNADEGQDFSAHVIIRIPSNANEPALLLLEQSGIGAGLVLALLNRILRLAKAKSPSDFRRVHPDGSVDEHGKPKTFAVSNKFTLEGHPAEDFVSDLNRGEVEALEMVTKKYKEGFDTSSYFKEDTQILVLKPDLSVQRPKDMAKHVMGMVTGKKRDYSVARIKFRDPDSHSKRSVNIDPEEGIPESYVKKVLVAGFSFTLPSSYDSLNEEVVRKMTFLAR